MDGVGAGMDGVDVGVVFVPVYTRGFIFSNGPTPAGQLHIGLSFIF